jgi:lariat debranching enzyme
MSVPFKYRQIGDFHEYYSGKRKAPFLTIFVGGNHEASSHLWELYYGGWVAPNIYYLGAANIIRFGSLRIVGLSGIWKGYNYNKSHHERLPYNQDDLKSIYHVRELDVRKLLQVRTQVDIGISHDWPRGVEWKGNWQELFAKKDLFEADARAGTLGSSAAKYVMDRLRPPYWFSAHLHCKFAAIVNHAETESSFTQSKHHGSGSTTIEPHDILETTQDHTVSRDGKSAGPATVNGGVLARNDDEIDLDLEDDETAPAISQNSLHDSVHPQKPQLVQEKDSVPDSVRAQLPVSFIKPASRPALNSHETLNPTPPEIGNKTTHFLALDKCLPGRKFLQILSIDPINQSVSTSSPISNPPYQLSYDKEWLAITRVFASDLTLGEPSSLIPPNEGEVFYAPLITAQEKWVENNIEKKGLMKIPENFEITAPVYDPAVGMGTKEQPREYTNPQTVAFCDLVGIDNKFVASEEEREERRHQGPKAGEMNNFGGRGRGGGRGFRGHGRGGGRDRGRGRGRGYR